MVEKDMTDEDMVTSIDTEDTPDGMTANPQPEDFAATLERLENLVERLESGELSLESSLDAFEQGIRLTRDAQRRLDEAELKVRTLTECGDGGLTEAPFPLEEPGR